MGAESSVQRDGKSQEDASASASASAGELSAEVNVLQEGSSALDSKVQPTLRFFDPSQTSMRTGHGDILSHFFTYSGVYSASWCLLMLQFFL